MLAALWLMSPSTAQGMTATMLMLPLYLRLPDLIRRLVTQVTPSAVYICTLGTLAIRAPRFRNRDFFKYGNLCRRCQQAIGASYILRGSLTLVVRTTERHFLYDSLDAMQTLAVGCHLCEALLGQRTEDAAPGTSAAAASWHGNRERVYLKVEFTQAHSFVDHLIIGYKTTPLLLSLETGSGAMFDKLQLSESECVFPPTFQPGLCCWRSGTHSSSQDPGKSHRMLEATWTSAAPLFPPATLQPFSTWRIGSKLAPTSTRTAAPRMRTPIFSHHDSSTSAISSALVFAWWRLPGVLVPPASPVTQNTLL